MRKKNLLYKTISIVGIFIYSGVNYYQWVFQRNSNSYSPTKTVSNKFEHLFHYSLVHVIYSLIILTIIYFWFHSTDKFRQTLIIHLGLIMISFSTAVAFKFQLLLPLTENLSKVLINDVLQKPIYPLLLLLFFIFEDKNTNH